MAPLHWQTIAAEQQKLRDSKIPKEWLLKSPPRDDVTNVMDVPYTCGIMDQEELSITEKDATELLELMATRKLTSYQVTLAFCKRAAIAQQLVNCLTQIFFDEALERAKELDDILGKTGQTVGPYHGLPFSIKDQFNIKGKDSCSGYVAWVGRPALEDAPVVRILRAAGAIFYVKTNNPQTLMHLESHCNVFGRSLNPFNRKLTPGGSSGGEGALVGFRGSPIGLAADGGGSIRSPAANNGLYGMKQTSGRVPTAGCVLPMKGCEAFPVVVGPVCRSLRDNEHFLKVVLDVQPWKTEPELVPIPWRQVDTPRKLKVGILADDGLVRPHPPVEAAINLVRSKLAASPDVEVVDWKPMDHARGYDVIRRLYFQDGGADNFNAMKESGEPVLPLSEWIMKDSHTKRRTIEESWGLNIERESYRRDHLAYWNNEYPDVDVLIAPVGPSAAPRHDTSRYWGYTAIFNCLDYPACVFPTGITCSPEAHPKDESYQPRDNEFDAYNWGNYDPKEFEGAPVCLQAVGRKWDCELVMKSVGKISSILGV